MNRWTIKYSNGKRTIQKTLSNSYIGMERVHKPSALSNVFENESILTNIDDITTFKEDLVKHERKTSSNNGKHIYGVVLSFLLDKEHSKDELTTLIKEINKRYEDLPFYAYKSHQGKGHYLIIYYCERYYFPDGKKIDVVAAKDIYRDQHSKKYCSPDNDKAKGDVIKSKKIKFSNKTSFFRFKEYEFTKTWNEFRLWFVQLLHDLFDMQIEDGVSFPQFVIHKTKKKNRPAARFWNSTFKRMNEFMNDGICALSSNNRLTDRLNNDLSAIIGSYLDKIKKREFEYDGRKHYMSLDSEESEHNRIGSAILYTAFTEDIFNAIYGKDSFIALI